QLRRGLPRYLQRARWRLPSPRSTADRAGRAHVLLRAVDRPAVSCGARDIGRAGGHLGVSAGALNFEAKQTGKIGPSRRTVMMNTLRILAACGAVLSSVAAADAQSIDWAKIDGIFGRAGAVGGAVHRYGFPRTDLHVTLDGVTIRPTVALGGWIALQPMGANMAMAMGDLVLLQTEVNPVISKL